MNPGRHLGGQALVESLEVAPESCAARHEHGLAVPAVQEAVPVGGKPPVRLIHPLPLLTCTAEDCRISYLMRQEVHIKLLQGSWRLSKL